MPVALHLASSIILQIVGFVGGFLLFIQGYQCSDMIPPQVSMLVLSVTGLCIPKLLFRYVTPAKCPDCGRPSYPRGSDPIVYQCNACHGTYNTHITKS